MTAEEVKAQLDLLLEQIQCIKSSEDKSGKDDNFKLDPSVKTKVTFRKVLHFFQRLTSYLEKLRLQSNEQVTLEDDKVLSEIELLQLPDLSSIEETRQRNANIDEYWTIINHSIVTGDPIGNVLRGVHPKGSTLREFGYRNMTECGEITLNLALDFIKTERKEEKKILTQLKKDLENCGMGQFTVTAPKENWCSTEGTSTLPRLYSYLPLPKHLNKVLPGTLVPLQCYIEPIVEHIIGVLPTRELPQFEYGQLNLDNAALVREELTKVLCHVPAIIEKFWYKCEMLPISLKFTFPPKDMIQRIQDATSCSFDQAKGLQERLTQVLRLYERDGFVWEKANRGDLLGLNLLLQHGLLKMIFRKAPTFQDLASFTSLITTSHRTIKSEMAAFFLDLISSDLYHLLSEAKFKANMNLIARVVAVRMTIEKTWDFHTFLLRSSIYDIMENDGPKIKNHNDWISKFKDSMPNTKDTTTTTTTTKKSKTQIERDNRIIEENNKKIAVVNKDKAKNVGVLVVMREVRGKLCYMSKTYTGEDFPLIDNDPGTVKLQGMDLKDCAPFLYQRIDKVIKDSSTVLHNNQSRVKIILGVVTTTGDAGGILAFAISKVKHIQAYTVYTLPERIINFYDKTRQPQNQQELLELAWTAFITNQGHLGEQISKSLSDPKSHHPIIEWEFQLCNTALPLQVLSTLLHVSITNVRLSFQRCLSQPSYSICIQFLMKCSQKRITQIRNAIKVAQTMLVDSKAREILVRKFLKKDALQFLGLTESEIKKYSQYFFWEEQYPLDINTERRRLYFGMLMSENDKVRLFKHMKENDGDRKTEQDYETDFFKSLYESKAGIVGVTFDPNIAVRVEKPRDFLFCRKNDDDGLDELARFGTLSKETFRNVDWFTFDIHDVMRFSISHFPIQIYLRPFIATFPNFFPPELKQFAQSKNGKGDPEIMIKSQIYVLLAMHAHINYEIVTKDKHMDDRFLVKPYFAKKNNSIIIDLEAPSSHHHFGVIESLLNLTYLDRFGHERIAGREIKVHNLKMGEGRKSKEVFHSRTFKKLEDDYLKLAGPDVNLILDKPSSQLEELEFPDFGAMFSYLPETVRLKFDLSRFYGGYPCHLDIEMDDSYKV